MTVSIDLNGTTALVTGGARGIGAEIASKLKQAGCDVVIVDKELSSEFAKDLQKNNRAFELDVSNYLDVDNSVNEIINLVKHIDVLVNNAGVDVIKPFLETTTKEWDFVLNINLKGVLNFCHVVGPHMVKNARGKIINISSDAGKVGSSLEAVYSAAKAGVIAFSKTLARELARYNIAVNCVCPGPTDTPLLKEVSDKNPKLVEALEKAIPFRRLGTSEDIANCVLFLASDLSNYITGQAISVSGGLTMC